jgi:transposase
MRQRALLGTQAASAGPYRQADRAAIRQPYVKTSKHDAADAGAICEAVLRPNMRFVPIKEVEQQGAGITLGTARLLKARTAQANQIRGLPSEFGLIVPQGITHVYQRVSALLDEAKDLSSNLVNSPLAKCQRAQQGIPQCFCTARMQDSRFRSKFVNMLVF